MNSIESLAVCFVTEPGDPILRIQAIADDGATFSIEPQTFFVETHYQVALASDPFFAGPLLLDVMDASASRFVRVWTGGTPSTDYLVRARVRLPDGSWTAPCDPI